MGDAGTLSPCLHLFPQAYQTEVPKENIEPPRREGREELFCFFPDRGKTDREKANPAQIGSNMREFQA